MGQIKNVNKVKKRGIRSRNIYTPNKDFKISRSKFQNFLDCERCFYLDRVVGLKFPGCPPYTLNNLVDELCKREFDIYREKQKPHPIFKKINFNGVPFKHEKISEWQDAKHKGIKFKDEKSGISFTGGIDDLWLDLETNKIVIVDYKATAKEKGVPDNILDTEFYVNYKIQIDFYAWLFKKNGFDICENSYFIFFNGNYHKKTFDNVMEFEPKLIHYTNDTSWIDKKIKKMINVLNINKIPEYTDGCEFCDYSFALKNI